jgi:3-isopropylmalate dehydrogenase
MKANIILFPGDGIGPEVVKAAKTVLDAVAQRFGHHFLYQEMLIGGCSIDLHGTALTNDVLNVSKTADAVLLGAVGGPKWDDPMSAVRPEQGLLSLRKGLSVYANLRPIKPYPPLLSVSPLRLERLIGVDFIVVRELTGGIYFGKPRFCRKVDGEMKAVDTMSYREGEIRRVAHLAFRLARGRRGKVSSVDKANVLECSRLWRRTVAEVALDYPEVEVEHILVDAAAMFLLQRPASFDVVLTENMFGDILTDEASMLTGSMGNLPSASLGDGGPGLYEPIHGSAPDIAGLGIANPIGAILSAAMLLRHSLGLEEESCRVEAGVEQVLTQGYRTRDIAVEADPIVNTEVMTRKIVDAVMEIGD